MPFTFSVRPCYKNLDSFPLLVKIRGASRLSSHNRLMDLHPRTHSASIFSLFDYGSGVVVLLVDLACEKRLCV